MNFGNGYQPGVQALFPGEQGVVCIFPGETRFKPVKLYIAAGAFPALAHLAYVQTRQVLQCRHGRVGGQTGLTSQSALHRHGNGDLSLRGPAPGLQQLNDDR